MDRLSELRALGRRESFIPIIISSSEDLVSLIDQQELNERTTEEYLQAAESMDVSQWLVQRRESDPEAFQADEGDWPTDAAPPTTLAACHQLGSVKPRPHVFIARIPALNSWQIPAYLRYGNWNDCPDADVHVALARWWNKRFGAEIIAVTADTIEFDVANPPRDRETALALAREHYLYCADIVDQGCGTVSTLAATILNGRYWYFWWD